MKDDPIMPRERDDEIRKFQNEANQRFAGTHSIESSYRLASANRQALAYGEKTSYALPDEVKPISAKELNEKMKQESELLQRGISGLNKGKESEQKYVCTRCHCSVRPHWQHGKYCTHCKTDRYVKPV